MNLLWQDTPTHYGPRYSLLISSYSCISKSTDIIRRKYKTYPYHDLQSITIIQRPKLNSASASVPRGGQTIITGPNNIPASHCCRDGLLTSPVPSCLALIAIVAVNLHRSIKLPSVDHCLWQIGVEFNLLKNFKNCILILILYLTVF